MMNRRTALLSGVAALAVAGVGGYVYLNSQTSAPSAPELTQTPGDVDLSLVAEMTLGDPDAPVTIVEYASFTCPHCKRFHEDAFKQIKENYVDTGKVQFIYREVYFDRFGLWAGMLARCDGGSRYFGIADLIYEQQAEWTAGGDPVQVAANLRRIGRTAGLTDEQVNACLEDGDLAEAMVAVYQQNAERDGINSTPSFMINGRKIGNMAYSEFARLIDEELSG